MGGSDKDTQSHTTSTDNDSKAEAAPPEKTWEDLGLSEKALTLVRAAGYKNPSPVQQAAIPIALKGRDLIASAQTGSGKTAAFVLPMLEKIAGREGTLGLVLAPTRELAQQIQTTLELFGTPQGVRSCVLIGGIDMRFDKQALDTYPQVIIATPGRLGDHLDRGNIWLTYLEFVVLDEADRMLDMGFADQLNRIMEDTPATKQTMLFSATIPPIVERLAAKILKNPERVNIGRPLGAATTVEQRMIRVDEADKMRELRRALEKVAGPTIVFTRSKDKATRVFRQLHSSGFYDIAQLHSDLQKQHREQALADFKSGKVRILIATDVAGRGIHVDGIEHVVNYDLPMEAEDYIHRIGRTGRAQAKGIATSFITGGDTMVLKRIRQLVGKPIPGLDEPTDGAPAGEGRDRGPRGGGGRGGRDRPERGTVAPGIVSRGPTPIITPRQNVDLPQAQPQGDTTGLEGIAAVAAAPAQPRRQIQMPIRRVEKPADSATPADSTEAAVTPVAVGNAPAVSIVITPRPTAAAMGADRAAAYLIQPNRFAGLPPGQTIPPVRATDVLTADFIDSDEDGGAPAERPSSEERPSSRDRPRRGRGRDRDRSEAGSRRTGGGSGTGNGFFPV